MLEHKLMHRIEYWLYLQNIKDVGRNDFDVGFVEYVFYLAHGLNY